MDKLRNHLELFWTFFKIGTFTFGGGYTMLPLIQREVTENKKWVSDEEIVDILAVSQSIPGVISVNSAILIGKRVAGVAGSIMAVLGIALPAFISILFIVLTISNFSDIVFIDKALKGVASASVALILLSAIKLGKASIKRASDYIISITSFIAIVFFSVHAMWAIVFGATSGYILYICNRRKKSV